MHNFFEALLWNFQQTDFSINRRNFNKTLKFNNLLTKVPFNLDIFAKIFYQ